MDTKNLNHHSEKENIFKIAEEYRKLMKLSSPSDIELENIEKIMELAVDDTELNHLINQINEQYALENNLLEDDNLDRLPPVSLELNRDNYLDKDELNKINDTKQPDTDSNVVELFPNSNEIDNSQQKMVQKNSMVSPVSNMNSTEMSICNSNKGIPDQKIKEYYASFNQLENQIETQQLQPLQVKGEVRKLQLIAEKQQRKAERNQRRAEINKEQAQMQSRYDEAQVWQVRAQTSLSESRQWLCLGRQVLNLSTVY
ncbi:MAG: hypothetical protein AAF208_13670 [Cyanobacteria bacterium P01_A01_bin.45]